uniref:RRM domain-containing protein n=1 Tax=Ditylenchus dipsaci TaxID=166011 RepID=A0A915D607_9BILA
MSEEMVVAATKQLATDAKQLSRPSEKPANLHGSTNSLNHSSSSGSSLAISASHALSDSSTNQDTNNNSSSGHSQLTHVLNNNNSHSRLHLEDIKPFVPQYGGAVTHQAAYNYGAAANGSCSTTPSMSCVPHQLTWLLASATCFNAIGAVKAINAASCASPYYQSTNMMSAIATQSSAAAAVNSQPNQQQMLANIPHATAWTVLSLNALQRAAEFKMATQQSVHPRVDTSKHHHIFVGDLSPEVDNNMLREAFEKCEGEISDAKVIRDAQSLKSRGYGFVSFPNKEDAEKAINTMNGEMVGKRAVRTNWAERRASVATSSSDDEKSSGLESRLSQEHQQQNYDRVFNATEDTNTTVYLGNLGISPNNLVSEESIRSAFQKFGAIKDIRLFSNQNYGFVIYEEKEVKCSWGKGTASNSTAREITMSISAIQQQQQNQGNLAHNSALLALGQHLLQQQHQQTLPLQHQVAGSPANMLAIVSQQQQLHLQMQLQAQQQQQQAVQAALAQSQAYYNPHSSIILTATAMQQL